MAGTNVTLRRRQLANRLRELRHAADLTVEQAAEELLCSPAKISRMETAQRGVSQRDVRDLCRIYGVTDENLVRQLMNWARESRLPGLRQEYGDLGYDAIYTFMDLEAAASSITELQITYLPALFQTEEYARALIRGLLPGIEQEVLERRVEARMNRQKLLLGTDPPRYWTFIDEAALRRVTGDPAIMEAQLERLLLLGQAPHVTVQVIPFTAGPYMCADDPFVMFKFKDQSLSDVVYRESLDRVEYLERPNELAIYREAVDRLRAVALSPNESLKHIAGAKTDFSTT
ncbi:MULTISPECIES: helix-turn-helix domain-containing protein [Microbispora]|uniref:Helix-turn-helix domain-containing protein n=1 Tax=Microbispora catharanthi TaxID=1712871 RepID=A0A5N6BT82_9ACTN|nr:MULTISPECIES: helix-turn-helix transcriptional regulator [Microbispora]KAB8183699.1 helix-turn-helix domain-containing protein [Microbispora catharanthi]GLX07962.1 transcriptional regulator [Microbispora sp. NBRC 16548]